jgi:hypothetical protein
MLLNGFSFALSMFDLFSVKPDPSNLGGVLLVVGLQKYELPIHYSQLPGMIYGQRYDFVFSDREAFEEVEKRIPEAVKPLNSASIDGIIHDCGDFLDCYDLNYVKDNADWAQKLREVRIGYLLEHHLQVYNPEMEITNVPAETRERCLIGLYHNLVMSKEAKNTFAELRAEHALKRYLSMPRFSKTLEQIMTLATQVPYQENLVENRKDLVLALAMEDFAAAKRLQQDYLRMAEK